MRPGRYLCGWTLRPSWRRCARAIRDPSMNNRTARTCRQKNDISKRTHGRADPEKCRRFVTRCRARIYVARPPVSGSPGPTVRQRTNPPPWVCRPARAGRCAQKRKVVYFRRTWGAQPSAVSRQPETPRPLVYRSLPPISKLQSVVPPGLGCLRMAPFPRDGSRGYCRAVPPARRDGGTKGRRDG